MRLGKLQRPLMRAAEDGFEDTVALRLAFEGRARRWEVLEPRGTMRCSWCQKNGVLTREQILIGKVSRGRMKSDCLILSTGPAWSLRVTLLAFAFVSTLQNEFT